MELPVSPGLVSVVIPVYNGEAYLCETLDSIFEQSHSPIEVIVVDDGSTDGTADVARSYANVHYLHQHNQGSAVARNTGLARCSGEYISLLDADDYWPRDKCQIQVAFLREHPQAGCVIGRMRNFLEEGASMPDWLPDFMMVEEPTALGLGAMLAHRWAFERIGNFNAQFWYGNDLDWFIRLKEAKIPIEVVDEVFLHRRINATNQSRSHNVIARERVRILKALMDRKRGLPLKEFPRIR